MQEFDDADKRERRHVPIWFFGVWLAYLAVCFLLWKIGITTSSPCPKNVRFPIRGITDGYTFVGNLVFIGFNQNVCLVPKDVKGDWLYAGLLEISFVVSCVIFVAFSVWMFFRYVTRL